MQRRSRRPGRVSRRPAWRGPSSLLSSTPRFLGAPLEGATLGDVHSLRVTASNPPLPLGGREEQLAAVREDLEQVRSGVGAVIVVEGRAGLGKTQPA
jgi:hypothetical protein